MDTEWKTAHQTIFILLHVMQTCKTSWPFFSNQLQQFKALNYDSISVLRNTHICSVRTFSLQNKNHPAETAEQSSG
jgi:hypothetical protein